MIEENAFVIKIIPYKDRLSIVKLFTEHRGCIDIQSTIDKKKWDRQFRFSKQWFEISKVKGYYRLNHRELIDAYYYIREDLDAYFATNILFDFVDKVIPYEENNYKIFKMTEAFMVYLKEIPNKNILLAAYLLKFLAFTGYGLPFDDCFVCGQKLKDDIVYNVYKEGFCHQHCQQEGQFSFSETEKNLLQYLTYHTFEQIIHEKGLQNHSLNWSKILNFIFEVLMKSHDIQNIQSIECLNWK